MDSAQTLSRRVLQAKRMLVAEGAKVQQWCRSRLRTARRAAQALHRQLQSCGENKEAEQQRQSATLVETTEQMVHQATQVVAHLSQRLGSLAQAVLPLVERVISQTRRRVLSGTKVPSEEKVLSLVEPHTRAIPRSPWRRPGRVRAAGRAGCAWRAGSSRGTRSWSIRRNTGRR